MPYQFPSEFVTKASSEPQRQQIVTEYVRKVMSAANFIIHEHQVPASHIRELPNALAVEEGTPEATLHLSVKHYVPKNNPSPQAGDITIIALHAMIYTKEVYEPIWDDLIHSLPESVRIRGIWMVDVAQQGSSYVLNEHKLGDGISWDDHPRDVLQVVNTFRDQMVPPLMGVGHSMGGAQLLQICKLHPRLFQSVTFLDPWFSTFAPSSPPESLSKRSINRKRTWESLEDARSYEEKLAVFKIWERRCFDRYVETCLRELPTMLEDKTAGTTPKTPAIASFHTSRRVFVDPVDTNPKTASRADRLIFPDAEYHSPSKWPYCDAQAVGHARHLPNLRPRALFLYGTKGSVIGEEPRKHILETTGTETGGSGGARLGCVQSETMKGTHFFPFENPGGTAKRLALWTQEEQQIWKDEKTMLAKRFGHGQSAKERQQFPPKFSEIEDKWSAQKTSKL